MNYPDNMNMAAITGDWSRTDDAQNFIDSLPNIADNLASQLMIEIAGLWDVAVNTDLAKALFLEVIEEMILRDEIKEAHGIIDGGDHG